MKRVLICPAERPAVSVLAEKGPVVTVPLLGQSLLEYWLSDLARAGVKQVTVLAHDRPEMVRWVTGDGARWGLEIKVLAESRELTPAEALLKYDAELDESSPQGITLIDHLPGLPELRLFGGYRELFTALLRWLPCAFTPDRVGTRESQPGVWQATHSLISPLAHLRPPCWIGRNVYIGPQAVIGPEAIIEDGAYVEGETEITRSCIGADTFVGRFAQLYASMAWGSALVNWQTGSLTQVPDPFMLCALRQPRVPCSTGWFERIRELYSRTKDEASVGWKQLLLNKEG